MLRKHKFCCFGYQVRSFFDQIIIFSLLRASKSRYFLKNGCNDFHNEAIITHQYHNEIKVPTKNTSNVSKYHTFFQSDSIYLGLELRKVIGNPPPVPWFDFLFSLSYQYYEGWIMTLTQV